MIQFLLRIGKRIVVLLPGVVIAYFSLRNIFPYFDEKLPLGAYIENYRTAGVDVRVARHGEVLHVVTDHVHAFLS